MINNHQIKRNRSRILAVILTTILVLFLLFNTSAFAEIEFTYKNGEFKSAKFLFDIPDVFSEINKETDSALALCSEQEDMYLTILLDNEEGITLDLLDEYNLNDIVGIED